jgi:hypothetical protein
MPQQCHLLCSEQSSDKKYSAYRFSQKAVCVLDVKSMVTAQISEVCVCKLKGITVNTAKNYIISTDNYLFIISSSFAA